MHTCSFWPIKWRLPWGSSKTNFGHNFFIIITILIATLYPYTHPSSVVVNRRTPSLTLEDISGSGDANALAEMYVAIDELRHKNQTQKDNIHNIRQSQQESNPLKEIEMLDL